jgi:hypothetical protein
MDRIVTRAKPEGELDGSAHHVEHARPDVQIGQPGVSYEARIIGVVGHGSGADAGHVDRQPYCYEAQHDQDQDRHRDPNEPRRMPPRRGFGRHELGTDHPICHMDQTFLLRNLISTISPAGDHHQASA